jgi:hypothetical protein
MGFTNNRVKALFLVVILIALIYCAVIWRLSSLEKQGEGIIAKIELFKKDNGKLPESLLEVGVQPKDEKFFSYMKKDNPQEEYVLFFAPEWSILGEVYLYSSYTKKWEENNVTGKAFKSN